MAIKKITMQDIADACGLSRNTVSKVFNNRGTVPEETRKMVLQKAHEIGYRQLPEETPEVPPQSPRSIALLTSNMPVEYHFGTFFVPAFAEHLSRAGYTLAMYELSGSDLQNKQLPPHMSVEQTAGIIAIELFDRAYMDMLCEQGIPTIFIDAHADAFMSVLKCDFLSMENIASITALTHHVIDKGAKRLGFVGDINHCNSFRERWFGFNNALNNANIPLDMDQCVLLNDTFPYDDPEKLSEQLRQMRQLPDAFVCANDFYAIQLMSALKRMGLSIPGDILVTGFDGIPQSSVVDPALTTAQIPSAEIGRTAADLLLGRIQNPNSPFVSIYVRTTPIFRASTRS